MTYKPLKDYAKLYPCHDGTVTINGPICNICHKPWPCSEARSNGGVMPNVDLLDGWLLIKTMIG